MNLIFKEIAMKSPSKTVKFMILTLKNNVCSVNLHLHCKITLVLNLIPDVFMKIQLVAVFSVDLVGDYGILHVRESLIAKLSHRIVKSVQLGIN